MHTYQAKWKAMLALSQDPIFVLDAHTAQIVEVNEAGTSLFNNRGEKLLNLNFVELCQHPEEIKTFLLASRNSPQLQMTQVRLSLAMGIGVPFCLRSQRIPGMEPLVLCILRQSSHSASLEGEKYCYQKLLRGVQDCLARLGKENGRSLGQILNACSLIASEFPAGSPARMSLEKVQWLIRNTQEINSRLLGLCSPPGVLRSTSSNPGPDLWQFKEIVRKFFCYPIHTQIDLAPALSRYLPESIPGEELLEMLALSVWMNFQHVDWIGLTIKSPPLSSIPQKEWDWTGQGKCFYLQLQARGKDYSTSAAGENHLSRISPSSDAQMRSLTGEILRCLVQDAGGFIEIANRQNHQQIDLYFPGAYPPEDEIMPNRPGKDNQKPKTILLVEDEQTVCKVLHALLEKQGYRIISCSNPLDALRKSKEELSDLHLLITDVIMAPLHGVQLAGEILQHHPSMRILFISGFSGDIMDTIDGGTGHAEFLAKPLDASRFLAKVEMILQEA